MFSHTHTHTHTHTLTHSEEPQWEPYHDGVVGSGDERDEEGQHHVDEEGDEGVEVHLAEDPHQRAAPLHLVERHEHVVPVDQREQALRHRGQRAELHTETQGAPVHRLWPR